jgi:hypothetical protein
MCIFGSFSFFQRDFARGWCQLQIPGEAFFRSGYVTRIHEAMDASYHGDADNAIPVTGQIPFRSLCRRARADHSFPLPQV